MKTAILLAAIAIGLAGCGDWGHGKDEVVHSCKAYADKAACEADVLCQWAEAAPQYDRKARCRAK